MLDPSVLAGLDAALAADDRRRVARYPGLRPERQPVHTVYVPADRFSLDTVDQWRTEAETSLDRHGPLPDDVALVEALVRAKLAAEPIEDLRIDFEDGYTRVGDAAQDADARRAARDLAASVTAGTAPPFTGIRMGSLESQTRHRGVRTLDLFLDELLSGGPLPAGFRVTLPKVTSVFQVQAMLSLAHAVEQQYGLDRFPFELQVETPQAVLGANGTALIAQMIHAAGARCAGVHYGTYDYSASVGIAAAYQSMEHPAADYAKSVVQVAAAGTGVPVSDGSTNILPVGDTDSVRAGWELHARLVRRSLERGFYQGWDLHPAQLPTRFAATFAFFRQGFPAACDRLRAYLGSVAAGATLDEPATAKALADYLARGLDCGAVTEAELTAGAGVGRAELERLRRFGK